MHKRTKNTLESHIKLLGISKSMIYDRLIAMEEAILEELENNENNNIDLLLYEYGTFIASSYFYSDERIGALPQYEDDLDRENYIENSNDDYISPYMAKVVFRDTESDARMTLIRTFNRFIWFFKRLYENIKIIIFYLLLPVALLSSRYTIFNILLYPLLCVFKLIYNNISMHDHTSRPKGVRYDSEFDLYKRSLGVIKPFTLNTPIIDISIRLYDPRELGLETITNVMKGEVYPWHE